MRNWMDDFDVDDGVLPSGPSGQTAVVSEEGGAYVTISQQGSERHHRQQAVSEEPSTDAS
jgi:hypothetical protein